MEEVERWGEYERAMWATGLARYQERLREMVSRGDWLLDLGAGPGQWSAAAANEGARVVSFDRRIGQQLRASRRATLGSLHTVQGDAVRLPFASGRFDVVLCNLVLPYVEVETCLAEVARVLRPGGGLFGLCHGAGYYLLQASRELFPLRRNFVRRLLVLGYTVAHHGLRLRRYRYETYQTPRGIHGALERSGFEVTALRLGGHPLMPEQRFLRLPVFFEFLAHRRVI
jgi:ubiquinone/menaquinone biosynthesis C-methylase UbiE